MKVSGNIEYQSHVQTYGWEKSWKKNGQLAGTSGKAKTSGSSEDTFDWRNENKYDVYYRVHAQSYGWLGWAKNGERPERKVLRKDLKLFRSYWWKKGGAAPEVQKTFIKK